MKKASAQYRNEIAELKRRVASLEKELARNGGRAARTARRTEAEEGDAPIRFSAKGFASHRKRLGVSAAEAALLIGVSTPTVYGWEGGTKPRQHQMEGIAAFRKMGKREANAKLESLGG